MNLANPGKVSGTGAIAATVGILALLLFFSPLFQSRKGGTPTGLTAPDYPNHPIYSTYDFDEADNIVNIGLRPLYLPANWVFEAVKRDTALTRALSDLALEARFFPFVRGNDVNHFLRNGHLDAGIGGDMPALTIAATYDVIIPTMVQHGFSSIVANRPMLIKELNGKRIGVPYRSNAHFAVLEALASEGLTEKDVDFVAMETIDMPAALQDGRIDAFSSWEPTPAIALDENPEAVVIHRSLSSGYLYFSRSFANKHPEAVRHIVAAQVRAIRWLQLQPGNLSLACEWARQSARAVADSLPECLKDIKTALASADILKTRLPLFIPLNNLSRNGPLHREFIFLKTARKIPRTAIWEVVAANFDRDILSEVLSDPRKHRLDNVTLSLGVTHP